MLNHFTCIGRLTKDPDYRLTQSEKQIVSFCIACERDFKDKDGERKTDFIDCVVIGKRAEFVRDYFSKGMMAAVNGRLTINAWTDKDGNKRSKPEIICDDVYFCESKKKEAEPVDVELPWA